MITEFYFHVPNGSLYHVNSDSSHFLENESKYVPCSEYNIFLLSLAGNRPNGSGKEILFTSTSSSLNESDVSGSESSGEGTVIECSDDFYFDNSTQVCKPECGVWTHFTPRKEKVMIGLRIFASSLGLVSSLLVVVLSCVQYKRM